MEASIQDNRMKLIGSFTASCENQHTIPELEKKATCLWTSIMLFICASHSPGPAARCFIRLKRGPKFARGRSSS